LSFSLWFLWWHGGYEKSKIIYYFLITASNLQKPISYPFI
jgi:hypothetical protein